MNGFDPFLVITLIAIGSNLDNIGIGLAYGIHHIRIPARVNVLINLIGLLISLLGATCGEFLAQYITLEQAKWVSCLVLVGIGLSFFRSMLPRFRQTDKPLQVREQLLMRHGVILGLALSLTNFASSFGVTIAGTAAISWTILSISIWGYLLIWLGNVIANAYLSRLLGQYASVIAGMLMVIVGLHQAFS